MRRRALLGAGAAGLVTAGVAPQARAQAATPSWLAPRGGSIALTFDDGPSELTPYILSKLRLYSIKATFFLQGSHVQQHADIVRRIAAEGHVIGNHGWSHTDFTTLTDAQARDEIVRTNDVIRGITGKTPVLFRYPYGNESAAGNAVIRELGMWGGVLWHWSAPRPGDYECPGILGVNRYILDNAVDQALILLHDGNEVLDCSSSQVLYLGPTITTLRARGFKLGVVAPADGPSAVNGQSWVKVVV